ncbi:MAG: RnfABCDGE type electron transport complex subunit B [Oscillospiraceae bacterium]|nr:RnfABCDGE type electron transport complex subunit B [Oscillospiraceae bacterium]
MNELLSAVLIAVGVLVAVGLVCALILVIAAKFFAVKVDEKEQKLRACFPGANCGACGFTGCDGYAKALAEDPTLPANLCVPGGEATAKQLGEVLGVSVEAAARKVAFIHCNGTCENTTEKYDYQGIRTCAAVKLFYGGDCACTTGCMGYGDCARACPSNAIYFDNGVNRVDPAKCTGCGKCTKVCPNSVISLIPVDANTVITCNNKEKGAVATKQCSNSCIGCRKCEKTCTNGAITVIENFAHIDYTKCTGCKTCVDVCPRHTIKIVDLKQAQ